jgi:CDP-paratose 2-epimerase
MNPPIAAANEPVTRARRSAEPVALVTGGAGFVGTNLVDRLVRQGHRVRILDSLARAGVERNLEWLRERHGSRIDVRIADVRERAQLREALAGADQVFHLAAQVAVTTSFVDPVDDFEVNAAGTVRLLEEVRRLPDPPPVVFTSTNKVYGALADIELVRRDDRWEPVEAILRDGGISELRPLDFCTPYGCSKGAADQYVLDYAKSFDVPAVVLRMSCIYGPHQHGTEDQGWVAHFALQALAGGPITLYGDGAQVRDILFVDDLVDAFLLARDNAREHAGTPFNVGGGSDNAISLLELVDLIGDLDGRRPEVRSAPMRPGDQRWYVSDTTRIGTFGWHPAVGVRDGVEALYRWLSGVRPRVRA